MSAIDDCLANNRAFATGLSKIPPHTPPAKRIAVVLCMDARLNTWAMLGLKDGDAHVIRNAGGVVTTDVIRSLIISQRLQGTREV
ncbi:MAG: carbonic anhydrase, partial [Gammaproteobacteria bacterium]